MPQAKRTAFILHNEVRGSFLQLERGHSLSKWKLPHNRNERSCQNGIEFCWLLRSRLAGIHETWIKLGQIKTRQGHSYQEKKIHYILLVVTFYLGGDSKKVPTANGVHYIVTAAFGDVHRDGLFSVGYETLKVSSDAD